MDKVFVVCLLHRNLSIPETGGLATLDGRLNGSCGFLPVFTSREAAEKFMGDRKAMIMEFALGEKTDA